MPRQSFVSKDFFVHATEQQTKSIILEIPGFANAISFVAENTLAQSWRFLYERINGNDHYIDVSLIPLNDGQTCVNLYGTYANGHSFYKDHYVLNALNNFESAIQAALNGIAEKYIPGEPSINKIHQALRSMVQLFQ